MYMKKDHSLKRKQLNYKKSRYNTKIVKLHFQKITLYMPQSISSFLYLFRPSYLSAVNE